MGIKRRLALIGPVYPFRGGIAHYTTLLHRTLRERGHEVTTTADGLRIAPLYPRRTDAAPICGSTAGRPWRISVRVDHPDAKMASEQALDDLKNGADSLTLVFSGSRSAR